MRAESPTAISSQMNITAETIIPPSPAEVPRQHVSDEGRDTAIREVELTDQTNLLPFRKILVVFLSLACCGLVASLDSTIVATALPTISGVFHAGSISSWVPSATLLTSTAFQPLYGRFSEYVFSYLLRSQRLIRNSIFGRKAMLIVAMALFMIGSLASGFSRNINELIVFRGEFDTWIILTRVAIHKFRHIWCWRRRYSHDGSGDY